MVILLNREGDEIATMHQERIGPFIAELRKENNLTQKELAEQLNITQAAISKWEKGISFPDLFLIENLSNILGVKISELLNGERLQEVPTLDTIDAMVSNLIVESSVVSSKQKKKINQLWFAVVTLLITIVCIVTVFLIHYYTTPPTFEVVDSYFEDSDPYFDFYNQIYTVIVKYNGYITDKNCKQQDEFFYKKYQNVFSEVEALYIVYYKDDFDKSKIDSYNYISVLLP